MLFCPTAIRAFARTTSTRAAAAAAVSKSKSKSKAAVSKLKATVSKSKSKSKSKASLSTLPNWKQKVERKKTKLRLEQKLQSLEAGRTSDGHPPLPKKIFKLLLNVKGKKKKKGGKYKGKGKFRAQGGKHKANGNGKYARLADLHDAHATRKPPPVRFSDDTAFDAFRNLFSLPKTKPPRSPTQPSSSPLPRSTPQSRTKSLESLINSQPPLSSPPEELRAALAELVGFSSVFSTRRLSRTARDPADSRRPRPPPPHYDRFERERGLTRGRAREGRQTSKSTWDYELEHEEPNAVYDHQPESTHDPAPTERKPPTDAAKLNVIHARYNHFFSHPDVRTVIDIGAGSGSWSLFAGYKIALNAYSSSSRTRTRTPFRDAYNLLDDRDPLAPSLPKIVALDTLELPFLTGIQRVQGDITDPRTHSLIDGALVGPTIPSVAYSYFTPNPNSTTTSSKTETAPGIPRAPWKPVQTVDVVLCDVDVTLDASGSVSGASRMADAARSLDLCRRVWEFTKLRLKTEEQVGRTGGGVLLMRHVPHPLLNRFRTSVLAPHFRMAKYINPRGTWSTDDEGIGSYFICWGYKGAEAEKWKVWT